MHGLWWLQFSSTCKASPHILTFPHILYYADIFFAFKIATFSSFSSFITCLHHDKDNYYFYTSKCFLIILHLFCNYFFYSSILSYIYFFLYFKKLKYLKRYHFNIQYNTSKHLKIKFVVLNKKTAAPAWPL